MPKAAVRKVERLEMTVAANKLLAAQNERSGYAFACMAAILALLVRIAFFKEALGTNVPFLLFYPALIAAAFYGGWQPTLLVTALGALLSTYYFMEPQYSLLAAARAHWIPISWFVASGVFISGLSELPRVITAQMNNQQEKLDLEGRQKARRLLNPDVLNEYLCEQNWWSGYVFAAVATLLALAVRLVFFGEIQGFSFLLFYPVLAAAAFYGGGGAGLLATALGGFFSVYFFMEPVHSPLEAMRENWVQLSLYFVAGTFNSALGEVLHRALRKIKLRRLQQETECVELRKSQEILDNEGRRKDEFLATLAHELRNPLAPISNALEILRATQDEDVRRRMLGIIERQVRQMKHLVDDLLDVERIARDKIALRKEPVTLIRAINSAIESVKPLMDERQHVLETCLPLEPVWIDGDLTRLTQIFANVLNNAAKYTELGGTIAIEASAEGGTAKIDICDNGIGIAPDMLPRIFNLFTQVDDSTARCQKGLGIGLALVRKFVLLHGGSISAQSDGLGKGCRFTIHLPVSAGPAVVESVPASSRPSEKAPGLRRMLVIDDGPDAAQTLAWMMEPLGYEVMIAKDGSSGIGTAKAFLPEVILLDIGMPVMDGFQACAVLRRIPEMKDTLIIAQTGYDQQKDRRRYMEAGFDAHILKPASAEDIQKLILNTASRSKRSA